jgi:hypothetical protein
MTRIGLIEIVITVPEHSHAVRAARRSRTVRRRHRE